MITLSRFDSSIKFIPQVDPTSKVSFRKISIQEDRWSTLQEGTLREKEVRAPCGEGNIKSNFQISSPLPPAFPDDPNLLFVYPTGVSKVSFREVFSPGTSLINSSRGNPEGERGKSTLWGGKHHIRFPNLFPLQPAFPDDPNLLFVYPTDWSNFQDHFSEDLYPGTSLMSSATVNSEKV